VPLLGNLFLPSFLCLIGALSYEYFQMEDKPFVRDLNEKQDSESLEVPVGQGLAPLLHAGRYLVICAAMRENEHSSKSLLVLVISRLDGAGLHFPQSIFQGLIVAVLSHWFLGYSASTRRNIAIPAVLPATQQTEVFWGGLCGMISVPIFTALTQCPAWSGMMLVLGLLGVSHGGEFWGLAFEVTLHGHAQAITDVPV